MDTKLPSGILGIRIYNEFQSWFEKILSSKIIILNDGDQFE